MEQADLVIVGAGAAGLMAGIWAGRTYPGARIVVLDGARTLGAKILVAGGGRCNVTHDYVDESAYAGSSRHAIKKVLRRFDVPATVAFFAELGVALKREATGKLFPTTDSSRTVLEALLRALHAAGVRVEHPRRVTAIQPAAEGFILSGDDAQWQAARVILATGGRSLPKSGSDGLGYTLAQALGHTLTPHILPALVPLLLPAGHFLRDLSGLATPVTLEVRLSSGQRVVAFSDALLCTHFGISGPAALDISRYFSAARQQDVGAALSVNWLPQRLPEEIEAAWQTGPTTILRDLSAHLPERLARALLTTTEVAATTRADQLTRIQRRSLLHTLTQMPLPIVGDRGYTYAEVTAGGIPLSEMHLKTMASRVCPGLYLCGEICDVDGRIGGYNFQWAWASGYVAGSSALAASS